MTDLKLYHVRSEVPGIPDGCVTEAENGEEAIENVKKGFYWFETDKTKEQKQWQHVNEDVNE